ncbi:deleted in malignant brain tumors 1 protein-like [Haliotis rubra]|uniref:deleted in malignant brain tumors 1 protein-like n=1 Tax=Haliotis rubra TaxID=36100 RepID=UPI001EE60E4B|nr:deleted in malignant brain tumors 1 protein-like [Haliotis rubra]
MLNPTQFVCFMLAFLFVFDCYTTLVQAESTPILLTTADPRVQVFRNGQWAYICGNGWNSKDAKVICRMMGYWQGTGTARIITLSGSEKFWLDDVDCIGNETDISECSFQGWGIPSCPAGGVAGVNCEVSALPNVRLTNGFGPWEGRVEIYENDMWQPVCTTGWDDEDAQVICRELGVRSSGGFAHTDGKYGRSTNPPIITSSKCVGSERDISLCPAKLTTPSQTSCVQAGVECYNCGYQYSGEAGILQSDNYPQPYPRNVHCLYIIRPTNTGQLYKLEFSDFKTESCCDIVHVATLNSSSSIPVGGSTYSGSGKPPILLGKAFAVSFDTDGSNNMAGFQAKWSPALVQDVVNMSCDAGTFNIQIDLTFLKRLYPASSERTIALADSSCTGIVSNDILIINTNADSCGTIVKTEADRHVYTNFLVDRIFATESNDIVRGQRWKIPLTCSVPRSESFSIHYQPYPDVGLRRASDVEVLKRNVKATSIEDVINISCNSGSFNIQINRQVLKQLHPASSEKTIGLSDPFCTGTILNDNIVITSKANTCGTMVKTEPGEHVYTNFLVDRIFAKESNNIVRGERWKVPIRCTVPRSESVSISYQTDRKRSKLAVEAVDRLRRVVEGHIRVQQDFPVTIYVYEDQAMTIRQYTSPQKRLGDDLYFRVQMDPADSDLKLVVGSCYALPTADETVGTKYFLTKGGCAVDSGTHILRTTNHHTDFQMKVFKFSGNYNTVYITCDVRVCPNTDTSTACKQTCPSRRKRSSERNTGTIRVRFGPVTVEDLPVN